MCKQHRVEEFKSYFFRPILHNDPFIERAMAA